MLARSWLLGQLDEVGLHGNWITDQEPWLWPVSASRPLASFSLKDNGITDRGRELLAPPFAIARRGVITPPMSFRFLGNHQLDRFNPR